ncbi:pollen-specific leucine-rich repeat extensin-like protein 1 [Iris pallida]|uniref:Pollen-specific leucine-rich repeat extensin-like protein 1 n=1 Tax=Iris pallida TaxID=29817 RepID=A0AAX6EBR0_IRIPA|nr:pollen-specific leucine-rich repeat extensin-like protein 1 [Iris pallida]
MLGSAVVGKLSNRRSAYVPAVGSSRRSQSRWSGAPLIGARCWHARRGGQAQRRGILAQNHGDVLFVVLVFSSFAVDGCGHEYRQSGSDPTDTDRFLVRTRVTRTIMMMLAWWLMVAVLWSSGDGGIDKLDRLRPGLVTRDSGMCRRGSIRLLHAIAADACPTTLMQ